MLYIKRIPEAEIRILGTVASFRQERSPPVTAVPILDKRVIESEQSIEAEENSEENVEQSKRDVSLEELLNDDSKKREKRKNKDKKSVKEGYYIKTIARSRKKSAHSRTTGEIFFFFSSIAKLF